MWKSKVPLRYKISLWLALNNKLLTWDNGVKRGWCGPNRCTLCFGDEESVSHLFVFCPYASQVEKLVKEKLKARFEWNKESLGECYQLWVQDRAMKLYSGLPTEAMEFRL